MSIIAWITLTAPLIAAALILLVTRSSKPLATGLSILSALIALAGGWIIFASGQTIELHGFNWVDLGAFTIPFDISLTPLSRTMLVIVTTISPLVFIFSLGYMEHEEGYTRYFAGLALFLFSMLGIVLSANLVMMFIFWELVGVSSYILIGHYFQKDSAADAAKQAFLVNRIGDFGFMLGILLLWISSEGNISFAGINDSVHLFAGHPVMLALAVLLIFCGTIGKSAQFPLHVWLPNSMEGPTPVSSLLHAATMVAAGVFLLARIFPLVMASPDAAETIAWIGAITALGAGILAIGQDDIKRILAYSTISQLGYMVTGAGLAISAALPMFHLFTHAFFKCLLFLSAGSVILGMHHEQDIWKMGGLKNKMPLTFLAYMAGMLALSGFPGLSGFFSKDLIMAHAWEHHRAIFWVVVLAAGLTPFYMARQALVVFFGSPRSEAAKHAHESPMVMVAPLLILSIPAIVAGYGPIQHLFFSQIGSLEEPENLPHFVPFIFLAAFALGIALAFLLYRNPAKDPLRIPLFENRFYIDAFYDWIVARVQGGFANLCSFIDRWFINGILVQGSATAVWTIGFALRFLQVGNIQAYALFFGAGVIGLIYLLVNIR